MAKKGFWNIFVKSGLDKYSTEQLKAERKKYDLESRRLVIEQEDAENRKMQAFQEGVNASSSGMKERLAIEIKRLDGQSKAITRQQKIVLAKIMALDRIIRIKEAKTRDKGGIIEDLAKMPDEIQEAMREQEIDEEMQKEALEGLLQVRESPLDKIESDSEVADILALMEKAKETGTVEKTFKEMNKNVLKNKEAI